MLDGRRRNDAHRSNRERVDRFPTVVVAGAALTCIAILCSGAAAAAEVRTLAPAAADGSRSYSLAVAEDGAALLSWVERRDGGGHALLFAELRSEEWGPAKTVASGEDWFVNWIDHPAVMPLGGGRLAGHWLVHEGNRESGYGYGIRMAFSDDRGASWRPAFEAGGEGTDGYAGFAAYASTGGGFEMAYLATVAAAPPAAADDPEIGSDAPGVDADEGEIAPANRAQAPAAEAEPRMALRSARFDVGGALLDDREVDADVCSCCTTAMTAWKGQIFLAFRDRRAGEFRDISFARLLEGDREGRWTPPELVHRDGWHIRGCPTNGPALAAGAQGPAVAWFTAANGESKVLAAFWNAETNRFANPIRIDSGAPRGWTGIAALGDGSAAVSWVERLESGGNELRVRRVGSDGSLGAARTVASVPAGRSALGIPKLVRSGNRLVLAWRDGSVRTAVLPALDLE